MSRHRYDGFWLVVGLALAGHAVAIGSLVVHWGSFSLEEGERRVDLSVWEMGIFPAVYVAGLLLLEVLVAAAVWGSAAANVPARIAAVGVASLLMTLLWVADSDWALRLIPPDFNVSVAEGPSWGRWAVGMLGVAALLAVGPVPTDDETTDVHEES